MFGIALDLSGSLAERCAQWPSILSESKLQLVRRFTSATAQVVEFVPHQPAVAQASCAQTRDGSIVLFDGVLDYRTELEASIGDLDPRASHIDVFAAAWQRWGPGCMPHLHGDFAAVVWNARTGDLWATSDHCAEVKVYYARSESALILSTHLPLVVRSPGVERSLNWRSLTHMMTGARETTLGETPFRAVSYVPGGETAHWQLGPERISGPQLETWVSDPCLRAEHRSLGHDEWANFIEVFRNAVRTRCSASAGTSAALSGGLDSTLIAGFAAPILKARSQILDCQTAVPARLDGLASRPGWEHDDWRYAQTMAQLHANLRLEAVGPSGVCYLDQIDDTARRVGVPVRNVANHDWLAGIARRARVRGCEVVLMGLRGNMTVSRACPRPTLETLFRARALGQGFLAGKTLLEGVSRRVQTRRLRSQSSIELDTRGLWKDHWARAYGLICPETIADIESSRSSYGPGASASSLSKARVHMAYAADSWACYGVRFRDPTSDRRVLAALAQLPAIAYFWRGKPRGVARRAGKGCVPDIIRARTSRGSQAPEEPSAARIHASRYLQAWQDLRQVEGMEAHFDLDALDSRYRRFVGGHASRLEAMFMHRIVSFAAFHRVQNEWWALRAPATRPHTSSAALDLALP